MTEMSAVVARMSAADPVFLNIAPNGELDWVRDAASATPFPSVREATRHATRLPSSLRAFGLMRRCGEAA